MPNHKLSKENIIKAYHRIQQKIIRTPLIQAHALSRQLNAKIYLKLENIQVTGSFKVRGAFNKLLSLDEETRKKGVVAASTGNHGAAVAFAANQLNIPATIFVPKNASPTKIQTIKLFGGRVEFCGEDSGKSEIKGRNFAEENNLTYVSPYNDCNIVDGQGTIGYELNDDLENIDEIYVAVGGGGLISGIAGYFKESGIQTKIIGCLPEASPVMYESVKAGKVVHMDIQPTLSDGTAGNLNEQTITFPLCQKYVDEYLLVSEDEIKQAMKSIMEKEHMLVEGSAGVAMAGVLKNKAKIKGKNIVVIMCGGNISLETLQNAIYKK